MRYDVLFNPIAGRGRASNVADAACELIKKQGHEVQLVGSERAGHIRELAAGTSADRLLVLGGDGSLREAASGLLDRAGPPESLPELGVLPFGSGNVVARELGLSLDPLRAAEEIAGLSAVPFDIGWIEADGGPREFFLAMLGVGYDAEVAAKIGGARATRIGGAIYRRNADVIYGAVGAVEMFHLGSPRFSIVVDGEPMAGPAAAAVISNTETYGKGMAMSPGALPDDGRLDVHARTSLAPWVPAIAMVAAQMRRHGPKWTTKRTAGRVVEIQCVESSRHASVAWQLDGDPLGRATTLRVGVEPLALALVGRTAWR